jgi:TatD DNase family protein
VIDSHCHLADRQFSRDLDAVVRRAEEKGVTRVLCIANSLPESRRCLNLADQFPSVFCTAGVHPHHAKTWRALDGNALRELVRSSEKVKAIGEIGLDYHYDFSPREVQHKVFRVQLALAKEMAFPIVVHCREAITDVRELLRDMPRERIVLHCCTERWEDVEEFVAEGGFLSFTGIATYPQAEEIRHVIRACPLMQMMIETDAPYLAPVPHRGKRNEPAFVVEVAKLVAKLKGVPVEEVDRVTTQNTVAFFDLPS